MRSMLSKLVLAPALMAAAALATNSAMAEATVKVPFGFTVAGKYCPAGNYAVQQDALHASVTLIGKEAPVSFNWVTGPGVDKPTDTAVRLKFDVKGDNYALRTVQYGTKITGNLDKTKHSEHTPVRVVEGQ